MTHEYREIQLSKKEVLFLFISLIVLAVVIFLLGVAVGRGVRESVNEPPVVADAGGETVVPAEPAPQTPPATQELGYHDLLAGAGGATSGGGAAATPPPPVTETAPPATPPPAAAEPPAAQPAAATPGSWFIRAGSFSGRQAADAMVANLKKLNVPAFVLVPEAGSPERLFRVRVGPYATQAEADGVRVRLVREGFAAQVIR